MTAIKSRNTIKTFIVIFSMILFLFSYVDDLFSKQRSGRHLGITTWALNNSPKSGTTANELHGSGHTLQITAAKSSKKIKNNN